MRFVALLVLAAAAPLAGAQAGGSMYASANFGEASYDVDCAAGLMCDDKDQAYKFALGWQFNRYAAAEAAYNDLGQADFEGASLGAFLHATAYEIAGVGTLPIGGVFSLLGRLGLAHSKAKYGRDFNGEVTSSGLTYGAGLQLDFTKNVAARLQWQRFGVKAQLEGQPEEKRDIDVLSFGIVLRAR
jgi:opacity protein-like surface antigen